MAKQCQARISGYSAGTITVTGKGLTNAVTVGLKT